MPVPVIVMAPVPSGPGSMWALWFDRRFDPDTVGRAAAPLAQERDVPGSGSGNCSTLQDDPLEVSTGCPVYIGTQHNIAIDCRETRTRFGINGLVTGQAKKPVPLTLMSLEEFGSVIASAA